MVIEEIEVVSDLVVVPDVVEDRCVDVPLIRQKSGSHLPDSGLMWMN